MTHTKGKNAACRLWGWTINYNYWCKQKCWKYSLKIKHKSGGELFNKKLQTFDSSSADTARRNSKTHQTCNSAGMIHKLHGWENSFRRSRLEKENAWFRNPIQAAILKTKMKGQHKNTSILRSIHCTFKDKCTMVVKKIKTP